MARIRRRSAAMATASSRDSSIGDEEVEEEEEEEEGDFDQHMLLGPYAEANVSAAPPRLGPAMGSGLMRRTTSLATVKVQRRARLAEKLREVFDVKEVQEVIAGLCPFLAIISGIINPPSVQNYLVGF